MKNTKKVMPVYMTKSARDMLLKNSPPNWKEDNSGPIAIWSPKTWFSGAGTWPFKRKSARAET